MRTPNCDLTDEKVANQAAQADTDDKSGASGKYELEIVQASLETAANESLFLTLGFKAPNGKIWKQDAKQIMKGKDANYENGFWYARLLTLFGLTGAKDTVGTATIQSGEFVDGVWTKKEMEVPSYVDLIGKKVGAILNFYQSYPNSFGINGYTGRAIPLRREDEAGYNAAKKQATTIWMPNYEKEAQPTFDFAMFFDVATDKTFAEMQDDNLTEGIAVAEKLEKVLKANHKAVVADNEAWDKLRITKLKANFKKVGGTYDAKQFIPSEGSLVTDTTKADEADDDVA